MKMTQKSEVLYAGWLEFKGTSFLGISPWTPHWFVLTEDFMKYYKDDKQPGTHAKGELKLDETTRIILAESEGYSNFRFAVATTSDILELGVTDLDVRNMWIQKLLYVAEKKSALGAFVMRVSVDSDYQNAGKWERAVVVHSVEEGSDSPLSCRDKASTKAISTNKAVYASFRPIGAWVEEFEPEEIEGRKRAQQQARKPDTAVDKLRDRLVEDVVTNITASFTTQVCNLLMDGVAQLFAAAERRLVATYRQRLDTKAGQVEEVNSNHRHTATPKPSQQDSSFKAQAFGVFEQNLPLILLEHLLTALGSLRALALSYRFQDPSRDTQMGFTRRLAAHQLERSLSRVLKSLEELQGKEKDKLKHLVGETAHRTTDIVNTVASHAAANAVTDEAVDQTVNTAVEEVASTAEQAEAAIEQEQKKEDTQQEESSSEQGGDIKQEAESLQHDAKQASLQLLQELIRPLLNREFLQSEAAPLMQDFLAKNQDSVQQLQGLAAEMTQKLGDALLEILDKKIGDLDAVVLQQVEEVIGIVSDYTDLEFLESALSVSDSPQQQQKQEPEKTAAGGVSVPTTAKRLLQGVAVQKDALKEKLAQIKREDNVLWDGTNRSVLVMVLLEQTDSLWRQLQVTVQMGISYGLYALLDMAGGGLSATAIATHKQQQGGQISQREPAVAGSAPVTTAVAAAFVVSAKPALKPPA